MKLINITLALLSLANAGHQGVLASGLRTKGASTSQRTRPRRLKKGGSDTDNQESTGEDPNDIIAQVFTTTNSNNQFRGNEVVMYNQMADGSLQLQGRFPTGGSGSGNLPTGGGPDPLGSQGPLVAAGDFLLTVSALSGEVAVFRIEEFGLDRTNVISLGDQTFPVSVAVHDERIVYVLDAANTGSVTGFKLSEEGELQLIENSKRVLPGQELTFPPRIVTAASQVGFTEDGKQLVVILKDAPEAGGAFPGRILVFSVMEDGSLSEAPVITEIGTFQFAFVTIAREGRNYLVATDVAGRSPRFLRMRLTATEVSAPFRSL